MSIRKWNEGFSGFILGGIQSRQKLFPKAVKNDIIQNIKLWEAGYYARDKELYQSNSIVIMFCGINGRMRQKHRAGRKAACTD